MPNIREHMRAHAAAEEELQRQRLKLAGQAAKLQSQLRYEEKRDVQGALVAARTALEREQATLAGLQEQERALDAQAEAIQEQIEREVCFQGCLSRASATSTSNCLLWPCFSSSGSLCAVQDL